jgi:hypothetical protein
MAAQRIVVVMCVFGVLGVLRVSKQNMENTTLLDRKMLHARHTTTTLGDIDKARVDTTGVYV